LIEMIQTVKPRKRNAQHSMDKSKTIDLHGYTKIQAIERTTFFLDQIRHKQRNRNYTKTTVSGPLMVSIITGSGKHSTDGPVLRDAIQKLLQKRQMSFQLNHGKGSFTVDALSGIDLYNPDLFKSDTKVLVKHSSDNSNVQLVNRDTPKTFRTEHLNSFSRMSSKLSSNSSEDQEDHLQNSEHLPTPAEIARDEKELEEALKLSQSEASKHQSLKDKEKQAMEQALLDSLNMEKVMEEEERIMKEIMELSKNDENAFQKEEELMKQVMQLSMDHEREAALREEEELKAVLAQSLNESHTNFVDKEDDILFHEALKLSQDEQQREQKRQSHRIDYEEQLRLATEASRLHYS